MRLQITRRPGPVLLAAIAISILGSGCAREFTIDPGIWILDVEGNKFDVTDPRFDHKALNRMPPSPLISGRRVDVDLEWIKDSRGVEREAVDIRFVASPTTDDAQRARVAQPFTGFIEEGEKNPDKLILDVQGRDSKFNLQLRGEIFSPTTIRGDFYGVEPLYQEEGVQGTFTLIKADSAE